MPALRGQAWRVGRGAFAFKAAALRACLGCDRKSGGWAAALQKSARLAF